MPAKSRRQQKALAAKYGWAWVKRHHFNRLRNRKHKRKRR